MGCGFVEFSWSNITGGDFQKFFNTVTFTSVLVAKEFSCPAMSFTVTARINVFCTAGSKNFVPENITENKT